MDPVSSGGRRRRVVARVHDQAVANSHDEHAGQALLHSIPSVKHLVDKLADDHLGVGRGVNYDVDGPEVKRGPLVGRKVGAKRFTSLQRWRTIGIEGMLDPGIRGIQVREFRASARTHSGE
jgi:hypothetical protein